MKRSALIVAAVAAVAVVACSKKKNDDAPAPVAPNVAALNATFQSVNPKFNGADKALNSQIKSLDLTQVKSGKQIQMVASVVFNGIDEDSPTYNLVTDGKTAGELADFVPFGIETRKTGESITGTVKCLDAGCVKVAVMIETFPKGIDPASSATPLMAGFIFTSQGLASDGNKTNYVIITSSERTYSSVEAGPPSQDNF